MHRDLNNLEFIMNKNISAYGTISVKIIGKNQKITNWENRRFRPDLEGQPV